GRERDDVARGRGKHLTQRPEQNRVREGARRADGRESNQLGAEPQRRVCRAAGRKSPHAAQVFDRGRDDVDARVRVIRPVDGQLVDAQTGALRADSSSVSKNQLRFTTSGSRLRATSARSALNPHCSSLKRTRSTSRRRRLYTREITSRFGPRVTRETVTSRLPIDSWLWPEITGATSGSSADRSVERSSA